MNVLEIQIILFFVITVLAGFVVAAFIIGINNFKKRLAQYRKLDKAFTDNKKASEDLMNTMESVRKRVQNEDNKDQ